MFGKRGEVDGEGQQRQPLRRAPVNMRNAGEISSVTCMHRYRHFPKVQCLISSLPYEVLVDSGSSISLVRETVAIECNLPITKLEKVSVQMASRDKMILSSSVRLPIKIGTLDVTHEAFICKSLVAPIILGTDFMSLYGIELDFVTDTIKS